MVHFGLLHTPFDIQRRNTPHVKASVFTNNERQLETTFISKE